MFCSSKSGEGSKSETSSSYPRGRFVGKRHYPILQQDELVLSSMTQSATSIANEATSALARIRRFKMFIVDRDSNAAKVTITFMATSLPRGVAKQTSSLSDSVKVEMSNAGSVATVKIIFSPERNVMTGLLQFESLHSSI